MKSWKSQSHVRWDSKYHLVFYQNIASENFMATTPVYHLPDTTLSAPQIFLVLGFRERQEKIG